MPHIVASDLGLHCLLRPVSPNTQGYYGMSSEDSFYLGTEYDPFFLTARLEMQVYETLCTNYILISTQI